MPAPESAPLRILGRYALYEEIASGGMATVHFGRLIGPVGFSRTVAIKRLHPQFAKDPEFVAMFLDEARLAARIRHPNVVQTLDVVAAEGELFLVMEYIEGESLARILGASIRSRVRLPVPYATAILTGALDGLHAAHEATNERGEPLGIVHRDMSPQNVLVGTDGVPRVLDFGVAKAAGRLQTTREGQLKGKMAYMAPEQLQGGRIDRRVDVFAAGVVLWESLTGTRLFKGETDVEVFGKVLQGATMPPSAVVSDIPRALDEIVMCALEKSPGDRFDSAHTMARALERSVALVPSSEVAAFVSSVAESTLSAKAERVARIEESSDATRTVANQPAQAEPPSTASHPGTRVVARAAVAPPQAVATFEVQSETQLSSSAMAHPQGAPKSRGVPVAAFVALAVCSLVAIVLLAARHPDTPTQAATTWTEPTATPIIDPEPKWTESSDAGRSPRRTTERSEVPPTPTPTATPTATPLPVPTPSAKPPPHPPPIAHPATAAPPKSTLGRVLDSRH